MRCLARNPVARLTIAAAASRQPAPTLPGSLLGSLPSLCRSDLQAGMVKKKFIDKKNAVTYSLVYRSTEDVDDVPERVLVEAEKGVGPGRVDAEVAAAAAAREAASGRRWESIEVVLAARLLGLGRCCKLLAVCLVTRFDAALVFAASMAASAHPARMHAKTS